MSRLGRNPFDKKVERAPAPTETLVDFDLPPSLVAKMPPMTRAEKIARFLQVDLPAEGFILGLKAALLLRSVWD
jgi:hypothetical protein